MPSAWRLVLVLPFGVAACGLISGLDDLHVGDASVADGSGADASDDGGVDDAPLEVGTCESGACGAPAGFQPVLFSPDASVVTCDGGAAIVIDPTPPSQACTCLCSPSSGDCLPQSDIPVATGTTCTLATSYPVALDGGCNVGNGFPIPAHLSVGPFPAAAATCTSSVATKGALVETNGGLCPVPSCSSCAPMPGFALCYAAGPNQPCPANMVAHQVGLSAKLACSSCTACKPTTTCGGTLAIYDDNACGTLADTIPVNGTCTALDAGALSSARYSPVSNPSCSPGASTPSVMIAQGATLCCP